MKNSWIYNLDFPDQVLKMNIQKKKCIVWYVGPQILRNSFFYLPVIIYTYMHDLTQIYQYIIQIYTMYIMGETSLHCEWLRLSTNYVCFRLPDRLTLLFADRLRFCYYATQRGSYRKKWSKSDHFERSYEVLKTTFRFNLSKIRAKMDNVLIFEEKSHSWGNNKILQKQIKSRSTDSVL